MGSSKYISEHRSTIIYTNINITYEENKINLLQRFPQRGSGQYDVGLPRVRR